MPRRSPRRRSRSTSPRKKRSSSKKRDRRRSRPRSRRSPTRAIKYRSAEEFEPKIQELAEKLSQDPYRSEYRYQGKGNKAFICIPNHSDINEAYHVTDAIRTENPKATKLKDQRLKSNGHWLAFDAGGLAMVNPADVGAPKKKILVEEICYTSVEETVQKVIDAWNRVPKNPFDTGINPEYTDHIDRFFQSIHSHMNEGDKIKVCYEDVTWQKMFCFPAKYVLETYKYYITRNPYTQYEEGQEKDLKGLYFKISIDDNDNRIPGLDVPNYSVANLAQNERMQTS
jgi:hypothetical protein